MASDFSDKTSIKLNLGDDVLVIATSDAEWYRVKYNDQTYYIYSYLTTKNASAIRFVDLEEPIYSSVINTKTESESEESTHNLRTTPCYDETETYNSEINELNLYGAVTKSQTSNNKLQVVALSENGSWAKVIYRPDEETQKTLYIKKSQLQAYQSENTDNELDAA